MCASAYVDRRKHPRSVSTIDLARTVCEFERQVAQILKDRIDLRDALTYLLEYARARDQHFEHWAVREAEKVLRRTA